jgi:hypothetical protein
VLLLALVTLVAGTAMQLQKAREMRRAAA